MPDSKADLPETPKRAIKREAGLSMDDVQVHRNSDNPAQLQADAYTQGSNVHLAPGQEPHSPDEAWRVVQQQEGRKKSTLQTRDAAIDRDDAFDREANAMGARASEASLADDVLGVRLRKAEP